MKLRTHAWLGAIALGVLATTVQADYPERPIKMVIPYSAGGATDISVRSISAPLDAEVGKPLIMANVSGAGGASASVAVKNTKFTRQ